MSPRIRVRRSAAPGLALLLAWGCGAAPASAQLPLWPRPNSAGMQLPSAEVPLATAPSDGVVEAPVTDVHGPTPRTLEEFVALAEQSHPRMVNARAAVEAARGKAVQAKLYPNPQVFGGSPQATPHGYQGSSTQYFTGVQQEVVTAGKLRLQQQAALRDAQKAEYELIRARYDVLRGVRQSYYQLLVAQRRLEIYKLLLDIARRSYEIGRQLAEAGEGTKADVLFWSIERDRAEVRLLNSTVFIETGRRELAAAIGLPRVDIDRLEADLFQELPNFDLKELQEAVIRSNAKPRAVEAQIAGNQWALERAVVQPIPNVVLMGGYQREINYPPANQGIFQINMNVPLFDRNQGNIRTARAEIATARAGLRMVELDLATQTAQAVAAYRTSQRLVDWYEEYILPKARETVTLTQTLYARGEVTFLSLLQAQKILTETELAYVDAQAERWTGAVAIADLLQLEQFPPRPDAPATLPMAPAPAAEAVKAPEPKKPAAKEPEDKQAAPNPPDADAGIPPADKPVAPLKPKPVPAPVPADPRPVPPPPTPPLPGQGAARGQSPSGAPVILTGAVERPLSAFSQGSSGPANGAAPIPRAAQATLPDAYLPGRGGAPKQR